MGIFSFFGKSRTFPSEVSIHEVPSSSWDKIPLGVDIKGKTLYWEPNKNPHLLATGKTKTGKTSLMEVVITHGVLHPKNWEVFTMENFKRNLSRYGNFSHVVLGAAQGNEEAHEILQYAMDEIEKRNHKMELARAQHISELPDDFKYIAIVIDEVVDLLTQDTTLEKMLESIVHLGPTAGVHLVLSTQDNKNLSSEIWDNIFTRVVMGSIDYLASGRGYYQIRNGDGIEFQCYKPSLDILENRVAEEEKDRQPSHTFVFPSRERRLERDNEIARVREQRMVKFEAQIEEMYKSGELDPNAEGGFAGFDHAGFPIWVGPRPTPKDNKEVKPETENGQNV